MLQGSQLGNPPYRVFILLLFSLTMLFLNGCESDPAKLTGNVIGRTPGSHGTIEVDADSIYISETSPGVISNLNRMLVGEYEGLRSFSVVKFNLLPSHKLNLASAALRITVDRTYPAESPVSLSLFHTTVSWNDTTFNPDSFIDSGAAIAEVSDTTMTLDFTFDESLIGNAGSEISFVIRDSSPDFMASIYSANSSYQPLLILKDAAGKEMNVRSSRSIYSINSRHPEGTSVVDGYGRNGFVLRTGLPDIPQYAVIHSAPLTLDITGTGITTGFSINIALLTEPFEGFENFRVDQRSLKVLTIPGGISEETLDIAPFINRWHNGGMPDYGILFWPTEASVTLDEAVIVPEGSVTMTYSTIPEVK